MQTQIRAIFRCPSHTADGKRSLCARIEKLTALWNSKLRFERPTSNFGFFTKRSLTTQFAPQSSHAEQRETKQSNCRGAIGNTLDTLYMGSGLDGAICFNRLDERKRANCGQDE